MHKIPLNNIIEKIRSEKGFSIEEINEKILAKVEELSGLVSSEGAAHIIANELGVSLFSTQPQQLKIKDIMANMRNIVVVGKVLALFDPISFNKNSNPGKVRSGIIGDETGRVRVSFWHNACDAISNAKQNDIIRLTGVYSRENNGFPELSTSNGSTIEINPKDAKILFVADPATPKVKKIVEITDTDRRVSLVGAIVNIFKPGFYYTCPTCKKKVKDGAKYVCDIHGEITPKLGVVLNIILDDGTETMRCVFFNELAEKVTQRTHDFFKSLKSADEPFNDLQKEILGTIIKTSGLLRHNSVANRNELITSEVEINPDI
jgi:ssDNA-binding replication factor A large subunit